MSADRESPIDADGTSALRLVAILVAATIVLGGVASGTAAGGGTPGEPASFFGSATDESGDEIPAGIPIVAIVDGTVRGEIEVQTAGEYGGSGAFDDKLRVDSTAGDEITFRLADADGPVAETVDLESGVFERDLVFPTDAIEYLNPEAMIGIQPDPVAADETVSFSADGSSALGDAEIEEFRWSVERDDEEIATFEGKTASRSFEIEGVYDVELAVVDTAGRMNTTTATFEVGSDDETESTATGGDLEESGDGETRDTVASGDGATTGGASTTTGGGGSTGGSDGSESDSGGGSSGTDGVDSFDGGNDGGNPSDEPIVDETVRIDDVFPDAPGTTVVLDDPSVREIVFTNNSASGDVSVREFEGITADAPPLSDGLRVASASIIEVPTAQIDDAAVIRAVVDPQWLEERDLVPNQLTVYRLPDGGDRWHELPTEAFEVEEGIVVEAETPGFSQFVIAGPEAPERTGPTATPEDTDETSESKTDSNSESAPIDGESLTAAIEGMADGSSDSGSVGPFGLLFALVSLIAAVWVIVRFVIPKKPDGWIP